MNDRELLELAAKAIGQKIVGIVQAGFSDSAKIIGVFLDDGKDSWNPLTDDGDVARLEATLSLSLQWDARGVLVGGTITSDGDVVGGEYEAFHKHLDKNAARRRATVLAAAAIGKAMP
jgi:hypothetical protein